MESFVMSFVTTLTTAAQSEGPVHSEGNPGNPGKVYIILPRPRAYLEGLMAKAFEGHEDVAIVVDRRYGERRTRQQPVAVERRRMERRRSKEEVIEVVIRRVAEGVAGEGQP